MCNSAAGIRFDAGENGEVVYLHSASSFRSDGAVAPNMASTTSKEEPNMGFWRTIAFTVAVLSFAATANAGVQMYSGEMIVHMRGSDAAGDFIAVPFGANCNTRPITPHTLPCSRPRWAPIR